jgi:hypothetical protein
MPAGHGPWRGLLFTALICCAALGCETAHYVIRNPGDGVVAIPEDTPELRAKAEKLMHEQFPSGYVIDNVRVVALGGPHEHREEVMLFYHAGAPTSASDRVVSRATPPNPAVVIPHVQPASLTAQPAELPAHPVPVNAQ